MNETEAKYWANEFSDEELDALADALRDGKSLPWEIPDPSKKVEVAPGAGLDPKWEDWYRSKTRPAEFKEWHANHPQINEGVKTSETSEPIAVPENVENLARCYPGNRSALNERLIMFLIVCVILAVLWHCMGN